MTDRPMHVCRACGSVDDDLGRYIEQLEAERDEQATLAKTMARKFQHLERTIAATDGKSKNGQAATRILELWRDTCVSTKGQPKTEIIPGGTRHKWVVSRLNSPGVNEEKCLKAVQGLARFPCTKQGAPAEFGMRAYHPGCALHGTCQDGGAKWADIKHALKDDERIELLGRLADLDVSRLAQPVKATVDETVAMRRVQRRDRDRPAVFRPQPRPLISLEQARQIAPFIANHDPIDSNHPSDPFEQFLDNLDSYGFEYDKRNREAARYQCPGHDDHHPSLDITRARDGKVLMTCRSHQCPVDVICARVDWPMKWLWPYEGRLWAAA